MREQTLLPMREQTLLPLRPCCPLSSMRKVPAGFGGVCLSLDQLEIARLPCLVEKRLQRSV